MLHLAVARREQARPAARRGNRVEVRPPVLLPREDDEAVGGPLELPVADDLAIHAPRAAIRPEYLARCTGRDIRHADAPRLALTLGDEEPRLEIGRQPRKGNLSPVR